MYCPLLWWKYTVSVCMCVGGEVQNEGVKRKTSWGWSKSEGCCGYVPNRELAADAGNSERCGRVYNAAVFNTFSPPRNPHTLDYTPTPSEISTLVADVHYITHGLHAEGKCNKIGLTHFHISFFGWLTSCLSPSQNVGRFSKQDHLWHVSSYFMCTLFQSLLFASQKADN